MEGSIQVIGAKIESQALMNISLTRDTGLALLALELLNSDQVEALATIGLEKGFDSRPPTTACGRCVATGSRLARMC